MKTRSILSSVRFSIAVAICPLAFSGDLSAMPVQAIQAQAYVSNLSKSVGWTPRFLADAFAPDLQGIFDDKPIPPKPWYIRMWPENRFLRILMIAGIIGGLKALLSKKSGTNTASPQRQQPIQCSSQSPGTPSATAASIRVQPTVSGWFYHANGTDFGPFDEAALRQLKNAGVFGPGTYIRRADGGNWITYADVFGSN